MSEAQSKSEEDPKIQDMATEAVEQEAGLNPDESFVDRYSVLAIDKTASQEEIERVYDELCNDIEEEQKAGKIGDQEAAKLLQPLNDAYQVLKSPKKRKKYDAQYDEKKRSWKTPWEIMGDLPQDVSLNQMLSAKDREIHEMAKNFPSNEIQPVEKKEKKVELKRPEPVSLSEKLNEIKDKPELLEYLKTQLAGEKVYHFTKDKEGKPVKQYLTVENIEEKDGKWVATLVAYKENGEVGKKIENYSIDKIKFKHWKKEAPKEDKEEAFIRDDEGVTEKERYELGSIEKDSESKYVLKGGEVEKTLDAEDVIKYEYDGGVAYAKRSKGRPKLPEGSSGPDSGLPELKIGRAGIEVESESIEASDTQKADEVRRKLFERGFEDQERIKELKDKYLALEAECISLAKNGIEEFQRNKRAEQYFTKELSKMEIAKEELRDLVDSPTIRWLKENIEILKGNIEILSQEAEDFRNNFDLDEGDLENSDSVVDPDDFDLGDAEDSEQEEEEKPKSQKAGFWGRLKNVFGLGKSKMEEKVEEAEDLTEDQIIAEEPEDLTEDQIVPEQAEEEEVPAAELRVLEPTKKSPEKNEVNFGKDPKRRAPVEQKAPEISKETGEKIDNFLEVLRKIESNPGESEHPSHKEFLDSYIPALRRGILKIEENNRADIGLTKQHLEGFKLLIDRYKFNENTASLADELIKIFESITAEESNT